MSEWRSVWQVRIKFAVLADNGGYPFRDVVARTPRELRRIVEWARRSPKVIGFPYTRVLERVGEEPTACRNGHPYAGTMLTRVRQDWTVCRCGGHMANVCMNQGCGDIQLDPPVYDDCVETDEAMIAKARRRLKQ